MFAVYSTVRAGQIPVRIKGLKLMVVVNAMLVTRAITALIIRYSAKRLELLRRVESVSLNIPIVNLERTFLKIYSAFLSDFP